MFHAVSAALLQRRDAQYRDSDNDGSDPGVPLRFTTLDALTAQNVAQPRFRAFLMGQFAAVALLLAIIGVFGVMAYAVSQRTVEIGLRIALGATSVEILRLLFGRGIAVMRLALSVPLSRLVFLPVCCTKSSRPIR
jgi:ABC-type antimicrobial peptide transport system permease subunit